jgi:hypothetical protein
MYVIHFCGTEQVFMRVFEMERDGRVSIDVEGIKTKATKIKYASPSLYAFMDIFLRRLVDYPPVKSREALGSWLIMLDVTHYALLEAFKQLFHDTIRL